MRALQEDEPEGVNMLAQGSGLPSNEPVCIYFRRDDYLRDLISAGTLITRYRELPEDFRTQLLAAHNAPEHGPIRSWFNRVLRRLRDH